MKKLEQAKQILSKNWRNGFTVPCDQLYPFQWMWDSGFVALGTSTYDLSMAMSEIDQMFSGQWKNGMLPHILFHSEKETSYFPNFDFWQCEVNSGASQAPKTSGITQPPVYGFVLYELFKQNSNNKKLRDFVQRIFPKVVHYHHFLYTHRDPHNEGLIFIYHPWESGRDNSPIWDEAMQKITIKQGDIPPYQRKDTAISDSKERPTQDKYDRYVYLLELGKRYGYDGDEIAEESPFLIQDTMMNAILVKSNDALIKIAEALNLDSTQLKEWQKLSLSNFDDKFWDDKLQTYLGYDLRNESSLRHKEIGGLVPLFAEIPNQEKASALDHYLKSISDRGYYLCPSFDPDSPLFDSRRYWRGPIWPQMNWMIYQGLKTYGFKERADRVKSDFIELVDRFGFYEYFEANKENAKDLQKGYGGNFFSWTASSYVHLVNEV